MNDYKLRVQRGLVAGVSIMSAMGERESIQSGAPGEDLWRGNELTPAPTSHVLIPTPAEAGEQMQVVSESGNDTPAGSGAGTVTIECFGPTGFQQTTTLDLNGTNAADLDLTDCRYINDFYVSALGTGNTTGVAVGPIKIMSKADNGLVYSMIAAGGNMCLVPHRMVPTGKQLHLQHFSASEKSQTKRCMVRLRADTNNAQPPVRQRGIHLFKATVMLDGSSASVEVGQTIPSRCIIKVSAWASANNSEAACNWWGYLVNV